MASVTAKAANAAPAASRAVLCGACAGPAPLAAACLLAEPCGLLVPLALAGAAPCIPLGGVRVADLGLDTGRGVFRLAFGSGGSGLIPSFVTQSGQK